MEIDRLEAIATLIGEPARIKILWALMDGRAHTATELAVIADVSPQSASMHLGKLVLAGLLTVISQGRHRYYSYAKEEVAYAVEAMANLIPSDAIVVSKKTTDIPFRHCRSCYDHLAGKAGVAITEKLIQSEFLTAKGSIYQVTADGHIFFKDLGIDMQLLSNHKRILARPGLDWSERRFHLAGSLGAALLEQMISHHWIRRVQDSRTFSITSIGREHLYDRLGLEI